MHTAHKNCMLKQLNVLQSEPREIGKCLIISYLLTYKGVNIIYYLLTYKGVNIIYYLLTYKGVNIIYYLLTYKGEMSDYHEGGNGQKHIYIDILRSRNSI